MTVVVAMDGNVQDVGVFIEDLLGSITVMDILEKKTTKQAPHSSMIQSYRHKYNSISGCYPVDDEDALKFVPESELFGCYGDRIKEAKSHGLLGFGVVTGRANDGETVPNLAHGSCPKIIITIINLLLLSLRSSFLFLPSRHERLVTQNYDRYDDYP